MAGKSYKAKDAATTQNANHLLEAFQNVTGHDSPDIIRCHGDDDCRAMCYGSEGALVNAPLYLLKCVRSEGLEQRFRFITWEWTYIDIYATEGENICAEM